MEDIGSSEGREGKKEIKRLDVGGMSNDEMGDREVLGERKKGGK